MKVLVLASQKGGAGKTTLALHIAVAAEIAGDGPVCLIDTDPQATLSTWWQVRVSDVPTMAQTTTANLPRKLRELRREGYALIVIDTPGRSSLAIREVIDDADLVLIPVKPSAADIWAIGATINECKALRRQFAFTVCQATRGASQTVETVSALSEYGIVSPVVIHNRVGFATALNDGRTVQELDPRSAGAGEIGILWSFLKKRMSTNTQSTTMETA